MSLRVESSLVTNDVKSGFDFDVDPLGDALQNKDGVMVADNDGLILMMNEVFKEMWGLSDELRGSGKMAELLTFLVKQARDPVTIIGGASKIMGSKNAVLRSEIVLSDSRVFNIHTFPMIGADNKIHGRIWYTRDVTEEKRVDDLRNLQDLMMENLKEGILMVRVRDRKIVYTNPRLDKIFGYKKGELIGKHVSILFAADSQTPEEQVDEISKKLKIHDSWSGMKKNIRKDGQPVWTEVKITKINNSQFGDVWVSIQNDVTSLVSSEDALSSYSKRLMTLFESSLAPMLFITVDGGVLMANKAACELFGRTEKELVSIGRRGMVNFRDKRWEKLNEVRKKTGKFHGEFSVLHKDGRVIEVEGVSATITDHEGIEHTHVVLRDRTKYLEKTRQLAESEIFYETLFNSAEDPIVIWDPADWKVVKANKMALQRLGFAEISQMQGKGGPENFSPGDQGQDARKLVMKMGKKAIKDGNVEFVWQHKTKEGVQYPVMVKLTRIDVGGKIYLQANIRKMSQEVK